MKMLLILLSFVAFAYGQDLELVWSDEFDGDEIDLTKWNHEVTAWGGGNGEFQLYSTMPENSFIKNGLLNLKPTLLEDNINPLTGEAFGAEYLDDGYMDLVEMFGYCAPPQRNISGCLRSGRNDDTLPSIPPIASANIRTLERFSFQFGRVEINAKIPVGDWLWPALWMLPEDWVYGEDWPKSGEIDIMEAVGNRDYVCDEGFRDINHVSSALHWGLDYNQNRYYLTTNGVDNTERNYGEYFHLYTLDWSPQGFELFVDDTLVMRVPDVPIMDRDETNCWTGFFDFGGPWDGLPDQGDSVWAQDKTCVDYMAPFDQEFHFIFNVAVGGTNYYIPDGCTNKGGDPEHQKPWENNAAGGEPPQEPAMWDFYEARDSWYSGWVAEGENNAMQIDYVRVYQASEYGNTQVPEGCPKPSDAQDGTCPLTQ